MNLKRLSILPKSVYILKEALHKLEIHLGRHWWLLWVGEH